MFQVMFKVLVLFLLFFFEFLIFGKRGCSFLFFLFVFVVVVCLVFQVVFFVDDGFFFVYWVVFLFQFVYVDFGVGWGVWGYFVVFFGQGWEWCGGYVFLEGVEGDGDQVGFGVYQMVVVVVVQFVVDVVQGVNQGVGWYVVLQCDVYYVFECFGVGVGFVVCVV